MGKPSDGCKLFRLNSVWNISRPIGASAAAGQDGSLGPGIPRSPPRKPPSGSAAQDGGRAELVCFSALSARGWYYVVVVDRAALFARD